MPTLVAASARRLLGAAAIPLALTVASAPAAAQVLFDNGPLITNPGAGFQGRDVSRLQTNLGLNTFGFGVNHNAAPPTGPIRVADNFTVGGGGWNVTGLRFFGYQTGSTTTSSFNFLSFAIWNGRPGAQGSQIVFGDQTTNRLSSTGFTNIYRTLDTELTNSQRPIMFLDSNASFFLGAGTYWVDFSFGGTLQSGPWVPPVTRVGQTVTGDAIQRIDGQWQDLADTGNNARQDVPFIIRGTPGQQPPPNVVPEPSTYAMLGAGLAAVAGIARRRRQQQS